MTTPEHDDSITIHYCPTCCRPSEKPIGRAPLPAVPESWEEWIEKNLRTAPDPFPDDEPANIAARCWVVKADALRARLASLGPSVPVSELRELLESWENDTSRWGDDRFVDSLEALIAKHSPTTGGGEKEGG